MPDSAPTALEPWHGTRGGYTNHKCRCDPCRAVECSYQRGYRLARPGRTPEQNRGMLLRRHGVAAAQFAAKLTAQNGVCAICGNTQPDGKYLCLDHDHKTGRYRGLLCTKCNLAIGYMADDPKRLEAAAEYLREWGS